MERSAKRVVLGCLIVLVGLLAPVVAQSGNGSEAVDALIELERERFTAIESADMDTLERLHADDFVLVNPFGQVLSRRDFLRAISAGEIEFVDVDQEYVEARVYGDAAVLRQRVTLQLESFGERLPTVRVWEFLTYERRDGRWQAVWSHGSEIRR